MAKMIQCRDCGASIANNAKICPNCGARNKKPLYSKWWFWVIIIFVILGIAGGGNSENEDSAKPASVSNSAKESDNSIIDLSFSTDDYHTLSPSLLLEYGRFMSGEKVVTQLKVASISGSYFQSHSASEDSYRYSFKCEFDSDSVQKHLKKDSMVTVAGIISDLSDEKTVILTGSKIVSDEKYISEVDETVQIEYCSAFKIAYDENVAAAKKAEQEEYASGCALLDYSDIARNPDSHKGEKVWFSGKVIQVAEGIFDSVTYRIATKGGYEDVVYVKYTRHEGESRVLEDDYITVYGECDGVTSYLSVLGGTITIPSVKMQYYNLNN